MRGALHIRGRGRWNKAARRSLRMYRSLYVLMAGQAHRDETDIARMLAHSTIPIRFLRDGRPRRLRGGR